MIRMARTTDIPRLIDLLHQVLEIHAAGRPDIFVSGTTKFREAELQSMIDNPKTPILVITDDEDISQGYAMCDVQTYDAPNMTDIITLYIDDLCVDENARGKGFGAKLYEAVKEYGRSIGAAQINLNVWACNPSAMRFYERMGLKPLKYTMEEKL